ncbi:MAG: glycosyltransferase family 4 protein [Thermoguttaceae bacterium]|jgi:UDP-glucose:(heptosyl)LPS alpha-1,3-glucosyltransferase
MKICLVINIFDPCCGGAERWTHQYAEYLLQQGHAVHVVAQKLKYDQRQVPIVPHSLGRIGSPLRRAEAAIEKIRTLKADIIHDMGVSWYCDVFQPHIGCWNALVRQKLLWTPPGLRSIKRLLDPCLPRYREHRLVAERQAANENQILVALAHKVAAEYQKFHNVPSSRIRVIYNGVDVENFSPRRRAEYRQAMRQRLGIADHLLLVLAVAHNFRRKGVPTLLKAMSILASRHLPVHALIVGGKRIGWQKYVSQFRHLPVTFVGAQPDPVPYYAAADVLVHPTFYDNCSLVFLEAAASGLPSLISREDGAAELLTDGLEGLLIEDPADADGLAAKMELMLDASLRERMGAAAVGLAAKHTLERNCREIFGIYGQLENSAAGKAA